jgi:uncharacterized protein
MDIKERIKELEDQLAKAKYNKATELWFGLVKSQIAKLRDKLEAKQSKKIGGEGFFLKKSGDATVILVGFPSVGKSTLLNKLTGSKSKIGAYAFTTLNVVPGVLVYKHAKIQILDVPGIISGASEGKGRGKEVLAMSRNSDLVLILTDATNPEHYNTIRKELFNTGIRLDEKKPDVKIIKKSKGGINVYSTIKLKRISKEVVKKVLSELKMMNVDVIIREDIDIDQLLDIIYGNRAYIKSIYAVTKSDLVDEAILEKIKKNYNPDAIVSAVSEKGIKELQEKIFEKLNFKRIFLKEVNKEPDMEIPLVLKSPVTIETVCKKIHRDFLKKFKSAKVWGKSAKFPGQEFKKLHKELEDGDIIEIYLI